MSLLFIVLRRARVEIVSCAQCRSTRGEVKSALASRSERHTYAGGPRLQPHRTGVHGLAESNARLDVNLAVLAWVRKTARAMFLGLRRASLLQTPRQDRLSVLVSSPTTFHLTRR